MTAHGGRFVFPAHESSANGLDDGLVCSTLHVNIANMTMLVDLYSAGHLPVPARNRRFDSINSDRLSEALIFSVRRVNRLHSCKRENPLAEICRPLQRVNRDFYLSGTAPEDRQFA